MQEFSRACASRAPVGMWSTTAGRPDSAVLRDEERNDGRVRDSAPRKGLDAVNVCAECGEDFGSVRLFDAHRVGKHAYTFSEGLGMDPPREDGRRCLSIEEMRGQGWDVDERGRWRDPERASDARERLRSVTGFGLTASEGSGVLRTRVNRSRRSEREYALPGRRS